MNIFKKTALCSSFLVFNIISSTFPIHQAKIPAYQKEPVNLEAYLVDDNPILGVKKESLASQEGKVEVKEKVLVFRDQGIATYYADYFHGRRTANGEIFDMNKMTTAASWEYSFGTILRVTNLQNGKQVEVKVNDRGAFPAFGVTLDLSKGAFEEIASLSQGVLWTKIEVIASN